MGMHSQYDLEFHGGVGVRARVGACVRVCVLVILYKLASECMCGHLNVCVGISMYVYASECMCRHINVCVGI